MEVVYFVGVKVGTVREREGGKVKRFGDTLRQNSLLVTLLGVTPLVVDVLAGVLRAVVVDGALTFTKM